MGNIYFASSLNIKTRTFSWTTPIPYKQMLRNWNNLMSREIVMHDYYKPALCMWKIRLAEFVESEANTVYLFEICKHLQAEWPSIHSDLVVNPYHSL